MKWIVVQGLSRKTVPELIEYGKHVVKMMEESEWFPSPLPAEYPDLTVLLEHVNALSQTLAAPDTGKLKTAEIRVARKLVVNDLSLIGSGYVQSLANTNSKQGSSIILSAGMNYREHGKRKAYTFRVMNGKQQNSVEAKAVRLERDCIYVWEMKRSNERNFKEAGVTVSKASFNYKELISGVRYQFRVRTITRKGAEQISQVLELVVL